MRILVCGGRDYDNWPELQSALNKYGASTNTIISGGAKGADFLARVYAKYYNQEYKEFPANWAKYGKAAGHIRNQQMIDEGEPDIVIAFKGGNGTKDMIKRARAHEIEVIEIEDFE